MSKKLFKLGEIVGTPAALEALEDAGITFQTLLDRHVTGDWGNCCDEDKKENDWSVKNGERILSAYSLDSTKPCEGFGDNTIWVITERDRSSTTILLPSEY